MGHLNDWEAPSDRAFLLRLSIGAKPSENGNRGRIEHIQTGKVVRFSSFEKARQFMSEVLADQEESSSRETSPPGPPDSTENDTD